jgi:hypothetical protein
MSKENKKRLKKVHEVKRREVAIDRQVDDSFPASDPPSYSGGKHIIGAPQQRESNSPKPGSQAVKEAERKVKDGSAKETKTY